jgi:UDPglucose--hexose-1-phosphate uridylyltransferase
VPHAVSQIIAMAVIPARLKRKLEITRAFYEVKKRSIFADILAEEVRAGKRIVYENHGFCVFCPYAARAPFELAIYPKRQSPDFHAIAPDEVVQLVLYVLWYIHTVLHFHFLAVGKGPSRKRIIGYKKSPSS